jgi:hypothetical protein
MAIWYIFVVIWYIFPSFGMFCLEKSGNLFPTRIWKQRSQFSSHFLGRSS